MQNSKCKLNSLPPVPILHFAFPVLHFALVFILLAFAPPLAHAADIIQLGAGSYATALPPGAKQPQDLIYQTENTRGVMPTNRWWSSLAWKKYSDPQFPHPLAVQATEQGLSIDYPGPSIAFTKDGIIGPMSAKDPDVILGLSTRDQFPDARVDGFSDWFVRARFGEPGHSLTVTYGHGSPYVFALCDGGLPKLTFSHPPDVLAGNKNTSMLVVSLHGKSYGLFGPTGCSWDGIGTRELICQTGGKPYFSLAVLPDSRDATVKLFTRYAYNHVTDSRVTWKYDAKTSTVICNFAVVTKPYEGSASGSIFALYPHQWRHTPAQFLPGTYRSVRGTMRLVAGDSFSTSMTYPGILPALPKADVEQNRLARYLNDEIARNDGGVRDTYGDGKQMGRLADEIAIADTYGLSDSAKVLRERLRKHLESWLMAAGPDGNPKKKQLFYFDRTWGTLIGYPAGYGSDVELNDHHFHYGYFIRAAAELGRNDPRWASAAQFGSMIKLLIGDIANPRRDDPMFPFLRNFDPYAGHSWASGHARFGDGNNQESSSEAVNAWYGLILWGAMTHDDELRDLGIWLYTTEITAAREYWLEVNPADFEGYAGTPPPWLAMIWGGKGVSGTWFSGKYEPRHAINWLPMHSGSLYLGLDPAGAGRNYQALVSEKGGAHWEQWADEIWMYRALSDPDDAMRQYESDAGKTRLEDGNSAATLYVWLTTLKELGQVDATIAADSPLYGVFKHGTARSYAAFNSTDAPLVVHFSDGHLLKVPPHEMGQDPGK